MSHQNRLYDSVVKPMCQRDGAAVRWADICRAGLEFAGKTIPENDTHLIRAATSTPQISEALSALFGSAIIRGFANEPDTTTGWVREVALPSFLDAELFTLDSATRLERLARGGTATSVGYGLDRTQWRLARYASRFVVDEQDMVEGEPLGAVLMAAEQLGSAARRVRPDLVYSLLLSNPTLAADSTALFDAAGHANLGTGGGSAMAAAGLGAGMAAVGNQVFRDGDGLPIHVNQQAGFLVTPPDLTEVSRRTARAMALGDGQDLQVRQESRLGSAGVVDPDSGAVVTGSATNWLLAARASSMPSIVVGGLDGHVTPQIRQFELAAGRWGIGWDIVLDLAVAAVDYRGVYFSAGA